MCARVFPKNCVIRFAQPYFSHVFGSVSLMLNPPRKSRRQLRINQEVHAA